MEVSPTPCSGVKTAGMERALETERAATSAAYAASSSGLTKEMAPSSSA